jgi:hypothetical protein
MLHSVKEALVFNLKTLTHSGLEVHPEGNLFFCYLQIYAQALANRENPYARRENAGQWGVEVGIMKAKGKRRTPISHQVFVFHLGYVEYIQSIPNVTVFLWQKSLKFFQFSVYKMGPVFTL